MASPSSLFSVAGKNVLVTGGSRGIGLMIAKGFVNAGANVLLTSRSEDACKEAAESLGGPCQYVASNVGSRAGCEQLAEYVGKVFHNRLDVLVNNAGTSWGEPLDRESGKANWGFDKVLDLVSTCNIKRYKRGECTCTTVSSYLISHSFCLPVPTILLVECQRNILFDPSLHSIPRKIWYHRRSGSSHQHWLRCGICSPRSTYPRL